MEQKLYDTVTDCPVIAAIKDDAGLERCLDSDIQIVFVLYGDIVSIPEIVDRIKKKGKLAMVHADLISGLAGKEIAIDFLKRNTQADGIISTKLSFIKRAKELGMATVFRFFVIDSMALENIQKQTAAVMPDVVEILPGLMPKMIRKIRKSIRRPLIAGGLISDKEDIMAALDAGAVAVSTTKEPVWFM